MVLHIQWCQCICNIYNSNLDKTSVIKSKFWVRVKAKHSEGRMLHSGLDLNPGSSLTSVSSWATYLTSLSCQENRLGASLVAQWLRVCLPMKGTRVQALVWEDPTCRGATKPVSHNYWACASGACAPQRERPRQWEAHAPRWRVAPARHNWRKPSHRNEDPTQPKINK